MPACWIGTVHPTSLVNRVGRIARSDLLRTAGGPDEHISIIALEADFGCRRSFSLLPHELMTMGVVRNGST